MLVLGNHGHGIGEKPSDYFSLPSGQKRLSKTGDKGDQSWVHLFCGGEVGKGRLVA